MKDSKSIGVLGTGLVGTALAEILLERDYRVHVWNRTAEKTAALVKKGAVAEQNPAAVGEACDKVFISVMTTDVVEDLCEGSGGLLSARESPRWVLDTTTGEPDQTAALAERLARKGVFLLDSTISGSSRQIRRREGLFMIGGDPEAFASCEYLFREVTKDYEYLGPSGSGSKAKLASNIILGLNRLVLAEGLVFAERLGLDLSRFLSVLKRSPAYSAAMDSKGEKMIRRNYAPEAKISQHYKDVQLILRKAVNPDRSLPLTSVHSRILEAMIERGQGGADNSAVVEYFRAVTESGEDDHTPT